METAIRLLVLLACAAATGCASVTGGNVQKMYVQTQVQDGSALNGANCLLTNDKGSWRVTSPGDTSIVRSNKRMEVKCDKAPLPQGVVSVESGTRAAMLGNILIGGVVGAVIDHSSGSAYEYPEMIKVIMGQMITMDVPKPGTSTKDGSRSGLALAAAQPSDGSQPGVAPRAASAPGATTGPLPRPAAKIHSRSLPPASDYAAADNIDAVPVRAEGKDRYAHYRGLSSPKAFVVYETGGWRFSNSSDAMTTLLDRCAREGRKCWLYAVDDQVVWRENEQQRIGRSDQLEPNP